MAVIDSDYNYFALIVAILKKATPEQAFELMGTELPAEYTKKQRKADAIDMLKLKASGMARLTMQFTTTLEG